VSEPQRPPFAAAGAARSAQYTLVLLLLIYVVNHVDRQLMYILVEPVRIDLALTDWQMGWIVGGGFALFYTFMGIPIGRLADRSNRRDLIAIALAVWSLFTAASGLARGFWQLMAARVGVGVGEAGCTPPAHSMISDLYPHQRRASALAIYQLGVPIGTLFGMAAGGFLAEQIGWREAFILMGVPGIGLAIVARLTLLEPERGAQDSGVDTETQPLGEVLRFMWRLPALRHSLIASSLQTLPLAAWGSFHAPFLQRVHGMSLSETGLALGLIAGLIGGLSVFASGRIADGLSHRDLRWIYWLPLVGALVSAPFSALAYLTDTAAIAIACIGVATLFNHLYSALSHAQLQSLVKPRMRAMMSAVALFAMNIVGFGIGPVLVGGLSDLFGGGENVRYALLVFVVCMPWACVHYALAARTYRVDLAAKSAA
jgi:predicted MFS family arabinose efflux permease